MKQYLQKAATMMLALPVVVALATCSGSTGREPAPPPETDGVPATSVPIPVTGSATGANTPVALAYRPDNEHLLMANNLGLWRWRAGSGWEQIDTPQAATGLSAVVVNPEQSATIYASGPGLGVIRSDDDGESWQRVNTGLPALDVTALALHSFRWDTLYAWVRDDGIYRTEDGGANWKRVPDQGPPDPDVRGLTHSTLPGSMNTGWLYAATPSGAYLSMDCF